MKKIYTVFICVILVTGCATSSSRSVPAKIDLASGDYECVSLDTSKGTIILGLDKAKAPKSVSNFLDYTNSGFYDGTIFHRVIHNFMIQGGGFTEELVKKETNDPIVNEADNGLPNNRGTIATARISDPHSATAQFFINTVNNNFLDFREETIRGWGYAVFGQVVVGMDVVDDISQVNTGAGGPFSKDVPEESITMNSVSVIECSDVEQDE